MQMTNTFEYKDTSEGFPHPSQHINDDEKAELHKYLNGKRDYCKTYAIELDENAIKNALLSSKLWRDYVANKRQQPKVYRLNRNIGYVANNIFVGTKADKKRIARDQLIQRRENRAATGTTGIKPLGNPFAAPHTTTKTNKPKGLNDT